MSLPLLGLVQTGAKHLKRACTLLGDVPERDFAWPIEGTLCRANRLPPPTSQRPRGLWPLTLVFLALLIATTVIAGSSQKETVSWSELLQRIEDGTVKKVELGAEFVRVEAIDGAKPATYTVDYPGARLLGSSHAEITEAIANANESTG